MSTPLANAGYDTPPSLLHAIQQVVDEMGRLGLIQVSGVSASFAALTGSPIDNVALAAALAAAGGGGGSDIPTQIAFSPTLNLSGNYSYPNKVVDASLNLLPGLTHIDGSSLQFNLIGDGSHTVSYGTGLIPTGAAFNNSAGRINSFLAGTIAGLNFINNIDTGLSVPVMLSAVISNANKNKVVFTVNGTLTAIPAAGDIIITGAGGLTVVSVAQSGATFTATMSGNFLPGQTPVYSIAAGKFSTAGGTNLAISNSAITNGALPAARSDNFSSSDLTTSDGGTPWIVVGGTPVKGTAPNRFVQPASTYLDIKLDAGTLIQDQIFTFKPLSFGSSFNLAFRFADGNNQMPIIITGNRVDLYPVIGGAGSLAGRVDNPLTVNVNNTIRGYFTDIDHFHVDINGTNYPELDYVITDAALRTSQFVEIELPPASPEVIQIVGLA